MLKESTQRLLACCAPHRGLSAKTRRNMAGSHRAAREMSNPSRPRSLVRWVPRHTIDGADQNRFNRK